MDEKKPNPPLLQLKTPVDDAPLVDAPPAVAPVVPVVHDTKIDFIITHETHLIDFEIKQIIILPSTSANITVYINTDRGQKERVLYMGTVEYLQWADDAYLYSWIKKHIVNAF
jgi:hypothetical protein